MKYFDLVSFYDKLEKTSKRLEKTHILSELLKKTPKDDLQYVIYLAQGKIFPDWDERETGMSSMLIVKVITRISGISKDKIETMWGSIGDLGNVAENIIEKNKQKTLAAKELTVKKVFENLRKLTELKGAGTVDKKISLVAELLSNARPIEARFIVRTVLNQLRIGVSQGTLRDAVTWAYFDNEIKFNYNKEANIFDVDREKYNKYIGAVQEAFDITNDFSEVALAIKEDGLEGLTKIKLKVGKPINVMLYQKVKNIEEGFDAVGRPSACEFKYDGIRLQIHKNNNKIILFTRRLENVTNQFPEVVDYAKKYVSGDSFILDSEAVGYDPKTKKYLPFQNISQRIKRKYGISDMAKKYPMEVNLFDIVFYNGKNLIKEPFKKRRELLKKILKKQIDKKIVLAEQLVTDNIKEAYKFYKESLANGEEGIMMKNLEGIYKPGSRVGYGVKIKPETETLDLVIIGAEWGEGKRAKWLSSFILACRGDNNFLEIGKVGTGIKEKNAEITFENLTKLLKPLIISEKGKYVRIKPEIVVEIGYEEIQKSPTYASGYALRFPRLIRLRHIERRVSDCDALERIKKIYEQQKK